MGGSVGSGTQLFSGVHGAAKPNDAIPPAQGAKIGSEVNGDARLAQVFEDGAAQLAGLSAGDVVFAVDGLRVKAANLERRIKRYLVGASIEVLVCRRDEIKRYAVTLTAQPATTCSLTTHDTPDAALVARQAWLESPQFQAKVGV